MYISFPNLLAGSVASALIFISGAVYIWAILVGKVQSNKVTWGVWCLVTLITAASYTSAAGGNDSIWIFWIYFLMTVITFLALVVRAKKGEWTWVERTCPLLTPVPIVLWFFSHSSESSLYSILAIDILGSIPLVLSVYKWPEGEYPFAWWLGFSGNAINLLAIQRWTVASGSYPLYLSVLTLTVALIATFRRSRKKITS